MMKEKTKNLIMGLLILFVIYDLLNWVGIL